VCHIEDMHTVKLVTFKKTPRDILVCLKPALYRAWVMYLRAYTNCIISPKYFQIIFSIFSQQVYPEKIETLSKWLESWTKISSKRPQILLDATESLEGE
jgi:hypothetical protein